ncbi:MAG: sigma-70 family RNA polymerase sigma factor [Bryobacteraceae bacterium]
MPWQEFDGEYVRRLIENDPNTERHFCDYFGELMEVKLRARVRSPQLREDIVQETFLRVLTFLRKSGGLEHPERLGAFVNTVCHNVLMEHFRSEKRLGERIGVLNGAGSFAADGESNLVTEQRVRCVSKALAQLPVKDQLILRALFLEDKDKDALCLEMNVDREYLRVLVHRAKAKFRDGFQKVRGSKWFLF